MFRIVMCTVALLSIATAALADDQAVCAERQGQKSIAACTRLISGGRIDTSELTLVHVLRGTAYRGTGDYNRAIADFTQAIKLARQMNLMDILASSLVVRANAYSLQGDQNNALADYRAALVLDPKNEQASNGIGELQNVTPTNKVAAPTVLSESREPPSVASTTVNQAPPSRWEQNGSTVYLVADGAVRRFYFDTPRDELTTTGAKNGTILFEGKKSGNKYAGTAYAFSSSCTPKGYQVTGDISDDEKQVTLRGKAPQFSSDCKVTGTRDDVLVFKFVPTEGTK